MILNFGNNITTTFEQCGNILISGVTGSGKSYLLGQILSQLPENEYCLISPKKIDFKEFNALADIPDTTFKPIIIIDALECLLPPHKSDDSSLDTIIKLYLNKLNLIVTTQYIKQKYFDKISLCFPTRICMHTGGIEHTMQVLGCKAEVANGEALLKIKGHSKMHHISLRNI